MSSQKQISANRANSKLSTGPKTEEGKNASSQNALQHGIRSNNLLIAGESEEELDSLVQGVLSSLESDDYVDKLLIRQLVLDWVRLERIQRFERETFDSELRDFNGKPYSQRGAFYQRYHSFDILGRYETKTKRDIFNILDRLRSKKEGGAEKKNGEK